MQSVGICLGASRISSVTVEEDKEGHIYIIGKNCITHEGVVIDNLQKILNNMGAKKLAVTGRQFRNLVNLSSIPEAKAIEIAYNHLKDKYQGCDTIVSAGGETFMAYKLDKNGRIFNVYTGNKCASGTGEFFLQQIKRMNLSIDEAMKVVEKNSPYTVAGRCSVFCKSDCTHALNKGESKGKVVAGLCKMMGIKILELLHKCRPAKILFIGGASQNHAMLHYIRQELATGIEVVVADEASYFEALGTAIWSLSHDTVALEGTDVFKEHDGKLFMFLPAIKEFADKVVFKEMVKTKALPNDECIVGLDVGSTTTKAVVLRTRDSSIIASVYLRTNGDPVKASRQCYSELIDQIPVSINIIGLGVTGSGRQIAGIHAETDGVINEIIAHATAAVHFDAEVDTIFEIGGQDAKYTYITNRVPSDYAMNEACSAGTGSFLEEAAKETMGIDTIKIAEIALKSAKPPNFNDQCAAFIGSDIKNAIQGGISGEDIVAGLVYSICQNYINRVKGNRLVGKKIFMQGGVCYNKAIPMAMAAITGKEIIVPPEPGLMGAYGVALEVRNKLQLGLLERQSFSLVDLASREVGYEKPFICGGGKEGCDRKCKVNMILINGKKHPFGGACNKYYNMSKNVEYDIENLDLVALREKMAFENYATPSENPNGKTVGIIKSLLVNSLYPLYHNFFSKMGFEVILAKSPDVDGQERKGASFCYPVELAHGFMQDLLKKDVDYIFLPHVMGMSVENGIDASVSCPFVQGEPYYLKTAFGELKEKHVLSPMLDFSKGYECVKESFLAMGAELGVESSLCSEAFSAAVEAQQGYVDELKEIGRKVLTRLEEEPDKIGIVLFGRSYNAFSSNANMGVPHKFSSRGYIILPWEFLTFHEEEPIHHMFWSMGQMILKSANAVKKHDQLFGTYITNFSCGPDSFIVGYFREIMGQKPSLTLELDSHTADAGIDTRIEAFIDVVKSYRELQPVHQEIIDHYQPTEVTMKKGKSVIITSDGAELSLKDKKVQVVIPSMGEISSNLLAASLRYAGINARYLSPAMEEEMAVGRANSSCKECLPYVLVIGSILHDIEKRKNQDEILVYFVADSSGPCRLGQYHIAIQKLIAKNKIKNVAILSLSSDNGYAGLGGSFQIRAWQAMLIADVLSDMYSALLVLAKDKPSAILCFNECIGQIEAAVAKESWDKVKIVLKNVVKELSKIPLDGKLHDAPKIAIIGEIFVRIDGFSRKYLVEKFAQKGIVVRVAPITEFMYFCDYLLQKALYHVKSGMTTRAMSVFKGYMKKHYEKQVKKILAKSGLYEAHLINIEKITNNIDHLISTKFTAGDTTLTVGSALNSIIDEVSGVLSIGPFGCMPNRIAEAIITECIDTEKPNITSNKELVEEVLSKHPALPFLSIESDGNPFPQVIEAKLEIFSMQVTRVHGITQEILKKQIG